MPDMTPNKGTGPDDRGQAATTPAPEPRAPLTTAPDTTTGTADRTGATGPAVTGATGPAGTGATGPAGTGRAPGAAAGTAGAAAVEPKPLRPEPATSANGADGTGIASGSAAGAAGTAGSEADVIGGSRTGVSGTGSSRTGDGGGAAAGTRDGVAADGHHDDRSASSLLPDEECDRIATRMRHAVVGFVDGPRDAVAEADEVLEELAGRLTEAVDRRRRTLRGSWQQEGGAKAGGGKDRGPAVATAVDTEQLRLALRDYRELTERLLHL